MCSFSWYTFIKDFKLEKRNQRKRLDIYENKCCLTAEDEIRIFINHHVQLKKQNHQETFTASCEAVLHEVH